LRRDEKREKDFLLVAEQISKFTLRRLLISTMMMTRKLNFKTKGAYGARRCHAFVFFIILRVMGVNVFASWDEKFESFDAVVKILKKAWCLSVCPSVCLSVGPSICLSVNNLTLIAGYQQIIIILFQHIIIILFDISNTFLWLHFGIQMLMAVRVSAMRR
jgi:hypothetical protein